MTAIFAVLAPSAWAAPPTVTNCDDSGPGSLRDAVLGAASDDYEVQKSEIVFDAGFDGCS